MRFGFHMELRRLGFLILALACLSQARAAPFAYVPNERSGTVSVIDTASDQVVATIKTGGKPRGIAASPDGRRDWGICTECGMGRVDRDDVPALLDLHREIIAAS